MDVATEPVRPQRERRSTVRYVRPMAPVREFFDLEWANAFIDRVRSTAAERFPELVARWPSFPGFELETFAIPAGHGGADSEVAPEGWSLIAVHRQPLPTVPLTSGAREPLPKGAPCAPVGPETVHAWETWVRDHLGLDELDAIVLVALVPDTTQVGDDWDRWSDEARQTFDICVGLAATRQLLSLARQEPPAQDLQREPEPIKSAIYKPHPLFKEPEDFDAPIWRYMSFTRLVSLLDQKALYFCRADLLGDPYEGAHGGAANRDLGRQIYGEELVDRMARARAGFDDRQLTYVNCWFASPYESAAMWHIYGKAGGQEGVAIRSSFRRLLESLGGDDEVRAGAVTYLDYATEWVPEDNLFARYIHKRRSYEHEREVRALIYRGFDRVATGEAQIGESPAGILVPCGLAILIEEIRVAPAAPAWFAELIASVVPRLTGLDIPVRQSDMDADPVT